MVVNAFFSGDDNTKIAKASVIYITNKTVRFGDNVYQFRNVSGFGIDEIKPKKIPFLVIVGLFSLTYFIMISHSNDLLGLLILVISAIALAFNILQPKLYGLKLYINSGDGQIFITSNTAWLKRAVGTLYDFMENAEEGSHMTIQVGGDISGNIIQGSKARDVKNMVLKEYDAVINTSENYRLEHHQD